MTLARGLAPAFLRFAGKRTDFLQFHNVKNPAKSRGGPGPDYYLKNYEDGELRGRGGGRARQRGLRAPGGPAPPAPRSLRPGGAAPSPGTGQGGHRAGRAPPSPSLPERGELGGARSPLAGGSGGRREQKAGTGERGSSRDTPAASAGSLRSRAGSAGRRGGFAPAAGGERAPQPRGAFARTAPRLSGGPAPRRPSAFLRRPGAPPPPRRAWWRLGRSVAACRPAVALPVGARPGLLPLRTRPLCHRPGSCRKSPPGPRLSAAPLSAAALPSSPAVLSQTKGFHLSRPLIHTKKLHRKARGKSPS